MISKRRILEFCRIHPDARASLINWHGITKRAAWRNLFDVRKDFNSADAVGRRTVFNIHGNAYRLIARVNYLTQRVFILRILTHKSYEEGKWK